MNQLISIAKTDNLLRCLYIYLSDLKMHDFRAIQRFQCKARCEGNGSSLVEYRNTAVETLYRSRRAGLQAIHAALDVVDLEKPNLPTSALPEWLLIPAENVHFEVTWV